jgi:MFS family permease
VRRVLALDGFRRFWIGQLGISIVTGTIRFAFVWLVLELTNWSGITGVIGLALGIPVTLITLPAGVLSDRYDRRALVGAGSVAGAAVLALTAVLIALDRIPLAAAAALAVASSGALALVQPAMQAMVPALVPRELLMTGIALQGIGQNVAQLSGVLVGGAAIQLLGLARAFVVLAVLLSVSAVVVRFTPAVAAGPRQRNGRVLGALRSSLFDGIGYVRRTPPLGTVVLIALVGGTCGGLVQLVLPAVAKAEMGAGAFAASLLFSGLGGGMVITTLALATRPALPRQGLLLAVFFSATCGPGMVVMGISTYYVVAFAGMLLWGLGGGFVMTTQRTILQRHTPDELMGRVISVHTLALMGSFPLAAGIAAALPPLVGRRPTLLVAGIVAGLLAVALARRPRLREV